MDPLAVNNTTDHADNLVKTSQQFTQNLNKSFGDSLKNQENTPLFCHSMRAYNIIYMFFTTILSYIDKINLILLSYRNNITCTPDIQLNVESKALLESKVLPIIYINDQSHLPENLL